MNIRPFNIDRMRRHSARSTPDRITKIVTTQELDRIGETGVRRLFATWMDKMRIKHLGKRKRIEFYQEFDIKESQFIVSARVVEDRYARPIQPTRSHL